MAEDKDEGRPCLACDKCDGFSLHVWRKRCRNCFCKREEHDVGGSGESASEGEDGSPAKSTMDFNTGARRRPQEKDPASAVQRTGKKWVRPPPEVSSKPQKTVGAGKRWTPPDSVLGGASGYADGGASSGSYSGKKWGVSANVSGGPAGGDGRAGTGAGAGQAGSGKWAAGSSGGAGASNDFPPLPPGPPSSAGARSGGSQDYPPLPPSGGSGSDYPPLPPPGPGADYPPLPPPGPGGDGAGASDADRRVSFKLDHNTEHAADPDDSASAGLSVSAGASAGAGGAGSGSGGGADFDIDIDFDIDQILANAGLDVPGKTAAAGSDGAAGSAGGSGAGASGVGAGGADGSSGVSDFPEVDLSDLPDPADFDDASLPPPPAPSVEFSLGGEGAGVDGGDRSSDAGKSGGASVEFGIGASAGASAGGGGGGQDFDMPSTSLVVSSYTWTPAGLSPDSTTQFMADIPLEYRPFDTSDGKQKSNKWRQEQNPPHDVDPAQCNELNNDELEELKDFIKLREQKNHGFGKVSTSTSQSDCDRCHKRFTPSSVVVEADRLPGKAWHPHCFTCKTCGQFLSQLEYYASDTDLYCGRHHAELSKPRCGGCDELILAGSFTKAQDKSWHPTHFCCINCDRPLATDTEKEEYAKYRDQVVCLKCYGEKYAKKCDSCALMIPAGAEQLAHGDSQWHIECFCCFKCQSKLDPNSFLVDENKLFCEPCFTQDKGANCDACDQLISPSTPSVSVGSKKWHEKCFVCKSCCCPLAGQEFFDHSTGIHCAKCYGDQLASKCKKCGKRLGPEGGLTYNEDSYHPDCFVCAQCSAQISTGQFVNRDDQLFCKTCFGGTIAPRCHSCRQPITSEGPDSNYTSHDEKSWHNACFSCAVCGVNVADTGFLYKHQKLHCKTCAIKH